MHKYKFAARYIDLLQKISHELIRQQGPELDIVIWGLL